MGCAFSFSKEGQESASVDAMMTISAPQASQFDLQGYRIFRKDFFAIEALFAPVVDTPSMRTVDAVDPCEIFLLPRGSFDEILREVGSQVRKFMGFIRNRVEFIDEEKSWGLSNGKEETGSELELDPLEILLTTGLPEKLMRKFEKMDELGMVSSKTTGRPRLTLDSKYMISARFNTKEMVSHCHLLKSAMENIGFKNILLVDAAAGDQFGPMTMQYLKDCDSMIGMLTDDYAEKTLSSYCSYYELKHYIENRYGCGTSQILKFFPIKLCEKWPPTSKGADGAALCSLAFTQDLVYTIDMSNQKFDAVAVAKSIANAIDPGSD